MTVTHPGTTSDHGTVVEVSTVTLGDELASDHAAGALYGSGDYGQGAYGEGPFGGGILAIVVKDAADFSDSGGWLTIGDETVFYTSAEDDEENDVGIITLAEPLTGGYAEGDRVDLYPPSLEKYAQVMVGDFGEAIEVEIPHGLWNKIADGIRPDGDGEVVTFHLDGDRFVLDEPVGQAPIVDGGYLDQETTPPETFMDGSLYGMIGFVDGGFVAGDPFGAYVQMSAEGITAANDLGEQTFQIDALTGNVLTVGMYASGLIPDEAHVVIGDLAGSGTTKSFMYFYTGEELDPDGLPVTDYAPGEVSSGVDTDGTRYVRLRSPDTPTTVQGELNVRSSVDASTRPVLGWSGDFRLRGDQGIVYALNGDGNRAPLTVQGSALVLDVPGGTMRLGQSGPANRLRSRDNADTVSRQFELEADTVLFDLTMGSATMRGSTDWRFQVGSSVSDVGVTLLYSANGVRISDYAGTGHRAVAASAFNVNSDAANKTGLATVDPTAALEAVRGVTVYDYTRKDDKRRQRGVLAQDVQATIPIAAVTYDDTSQAVDLSGLTATTLAAIQAVTARLEVVEAKTANLPVPKVK